MPFELIIFDCDGVLVDSEPVVNGLFVQMLSELGYELDFKQTLHEFSGSTMQLRLQAVERRLNWRTPPDFIADFDRRLADAMEHHLEPVPGVKEVLPQLSCRWCAASNGSIADIQFRLACAGLLEGFGQHFFSAAEVAEPKPAPDVFLHAARSMGVPPGRCAVIEDSALGVRAGVAAGMAVFGLARLTSADALRAAGACVFDKMEHLPRLLHADQSSGPWERP